MNGIQKNKFILIAFDLIFDYNSLLFSCLRTFYSKKNVFLKNHLRKEIELQSPLVAIKIIE